MFGGSQSQVSGPAQLFDCLWSQTSPFIHLLEYIRLVGLEVGHRMEGHACLTGHDVGLSDKGGRGPTCGPTSADSCWSAEASGARQGKTDDSFSNTSSREGMVLRRRFSQNLHFEIP